MRNKKILIGFTILSIFALSLACGSMTKLMTLNFNQDILLSILDGVEVPDDQSSYSFTVSDLSIQQDYLRVEGEFNTETEAVSDVFIDFELSDEEGKLLFGIQNTNVSQIQAEEIVGNGRFTVAITDDNQKICAMQKGLIGTFSKEEIFQLLDLAKEKGSNTIQTIKESVGY